jgi:hypothetical protein
VICSPPRMLRNGPDDSVYASRRFGAIAVIAPGHDRRPHLAHAAQERASQAQLDPEVSRSHLNLSRTLVNTPPGQLHSSGEVAPLEQPGCNRDAARGQECQGAHSQRVDVAVRERRAPGLEIERRDGLKLSQRGRDVGDVVPDMHRDDRSAAN